MKFSLFPGQKIQSSWWLRLLKVLIILLTILFFGLSFLKIIQPDSERRPWYDYSFDSNFNNYRGQIINCDGVPGKCSNAANSDSTHIVLSYETSSSERNSEITNILQQNPDITYDQILLNLEQKGEITNNLQAKDINYVQEYLRKDWLRVIGYTILFFLILSQMGLRIVFYIIYGNKGISGKTR